MRICNICFKISNFLLTLGLMVHLYTRVTTDHLVQICAQHYHKINSWNIHEWQCLSEWVSREMWQVLPSHIWCFFPLHVILCHLVATLLCQNNELLNSAKTVDINCTVSKPVESCIVSKHVITAQCQNQLKTA